jgi:hypothetical protein
MRFLPFLLIALFLPPDARADSDGYYCVGAGFIAVQFRSFNTPGLKGDHVLKIARYDSRSGPRWIGEVVLEDFQPHTLVCGAKTVLIEGIGERGRGLVSYQLALDNESVKIVSHGSNPDHDFSNLPEGPMNIGNWAAAGIRELPNRGGFPRFQLRVTRTSRREPNQIIHAVRSTLEEVLEGGRTGRSLVIHTGTSIETID